MALVRHFAGRKPLFSRLVTTATVAILTACAGYPTSPEDQAKFHADLARTNTKLGNCTDTITQIDLALARSITGQEVRDLFSDQPRAAECYEAGLEKTIIDVNSGPSANGALGKLRPVLYKKVFPEPKNQQLVAKLHSRVVDGNVDDSVSLDLGDNLTSFPELNDPGHQQIILDRTIRKLQTNRTTDRPLAPFVAYIKQLGVTSSEGKRLIGLFSTFNIRSSEISLIEPIAPEYAAIRRKEVIFRVYMEVKNGDRLFADDLKNNLRSQIRGVDWASAPGPNITTLTIEQVRNAERVLPERTETVTYSTTDVNIIYGALLMPRNASYLYEIVSGGAEIDYGYVISASSANKVVHDDVVRGKVGGEYRRCQNARIQNVFGGVSRADFVANDDMARRCSSHSSGSMDELRKEVLGKVTEGVLRVSVIRQANELN